MKRLLTLIFSWWSGQTIGTRLFTLRRGIAVGADEAGNRYYRERRGSRRWVIFAGQSEATAVPPAWNAWLRHVVDEPPSIATARPHAWQQPHRPNPTGTGQAYRPPGSLAAPRARKVSGDYEAWTP
ncbi:MAG: NADH:ubiquinone oxidoreductase subunit NDUFA12 [Bauldia sp.]